MKKRLAFLALALLLVGIYGCGTSDDPIDETTDTEKVTIPVPEAELGEGLVIGTHAPDFELSDGFGNNHTLSEHLDNGMNVVIVFYRTGG